MKRKPTSKRGAGRVGEGAIPSRALRHNFEKMNLPIQPPFPPMEARTAKEIPRGADWQYEPKWDGFRCLAFRSGEKVALQSKAGQPLGRYFPELVAALQKLPPRQFVLDGEVVIEHDGGLHFDELLQRIHPAESRVRRLAHETPAKILAFDLLVDSSGRSLLDLQLRQRRAALEKFIRSIAKNKSLELCPATTDYDEATRWMRQLGMRGCDGIVAKELDSEYRSGERAGMVKIKRLRTADCVVGGFRYARKGNVVGSLLLGLYNSQGLLDHLGFCSSFNLEQRKELLKIVRPLIGGEGFTGGAPGGPSRWSTERSTEWERLKPELVCEVQYDHFSSGRFRHGTKFLRWRPEKSPRQCTFDQLETAKRTNLKRSA